MKLTKAQAKLLKKFADGSIYCRMWQGADAWGFWAGDLRDTIRVDVRSVWKLQELGLIECHKEDWHSKYYRITDAGRITAKEISA